MKLLFVFVFAYVCLAFFIGQSQVEANKGGSNNIVLKDGHLILSSQGKKGKHSDNIVIKDGGSEGGHGCGCHQHWGSSWW